MALPAQIRQLLVLKIENGHLSAGQRLLSSRRLSAILGIARNTVSSAYQQLADEGTLLSQQRSGVFVATPPLTARVQPVVLEKEKVAPWQPRFAMQPSTLRHISKPRDWQSYPYPFRRLPAAMASP